MVAAAWTTETRSKQQQCEGSGLINTEYNSSYGGKLYGIYSILQFIVDIQVAKEGKFGRIGIRYNNLTEVLDTSQKS